MDTEEEIIGTLTGTLGVEKVEEHEDGSATYEFTFDDKNKNQLAKYGLEFILYCAAYGWDTQDALDSLKRGTEEDD